MAATLKQIAEAEGRSMADVIRESVDSFVVVRGVRDRVQQKDAALAIAGKFRSGLGDLAAHHDDYLTEDFSD